MNYVVEYRLKRASKLLVDTENSVCTIAHETGFENIGYFCRRFKKLYGVTPIYYRNHCHSAE
ncbi:MAG: helix-turn-helix transcriptional regulator [[Eubacterium] siraeum]